MRNQWLERWNVYTDSETSNQKMWKTFNDWKHIKSCFSTESAAAINNIMMNQFFLQVLQYNIRKSLKIQKSFLINRKIHKFDIIVI